MIKGRDTYRVSTKLSPAPMAKGLEFTTPLTLVVRRPNSRFPSLTFMCRQKNGVYADCNVNKDDVTPRTRLSSLSVPFLPLWQSQLISEPEWSHLTSGD